MTDKKTLVIGGGSSAAELSLALNKLNADVTLVVRGNSLKSEQILIDKLARQPDISMLYNHKVLEIDFDNSGHINGTMLQSDDKYLYLATQGIFSATGQKPQTALVKNYLALDDKNYITCQSNSGTPCALKSGEDSTLLTLGKTAAPLLNNLTCAAKGAQAALTLSNTLAKQHPGNKKLTIAMIGGGFGGGTASLYALRNQLNVILFERENPRKTDQVWPLSDNQSPPLHTLNQQLNHLGITRKNNSVVKIEEVNNGRYQITTEDGTTEVDGIIINTLEYPAKIPMTASLQKRLTIHDFSREYQWFHTSVEGILATGDVVSPRQSLPKQAILAAYNGFLAGILALQKIKNTGDYFSTEDK